MDVEARRDGKVIHVRRNTRLSVAKVLTGGLESIRDLGFFILRDTAGNPNGALNFLGVESDKPYIGDMKARVEPETAIKDSLLVVGLNLAVDPSPLATIQRSFPRGEAIVDEFTTIYGARLPDNDSNSHLISRAESLAQGGSGVTFDRVQVFAVEGRLDPSLLTAAMGHYLRLQAEQFGIGSLVDIKYRQYPYGKARKVNFGGS